MTTFQIIICVVFVALQVGDIVSTTLALQKSNVVEGNPIVRWIMDRVGIIPALILSKLVVIGLFGVAVYLSPYAVYLMGLMSLFYVWVVVNNIKIIQGR